jgi:hypothetical protein
MRDAPGRRLAARAGAVVFAATLALAAGMSAAQPAGEQSWGTADGGAVAIEADGTYNMAFTDEGTKASVFSDGKVTSKTTTADGKTEYMLKPAAPVAGVDSWVVDVDASGNGVLYAVSKGSRRQAATLTK